MVFFVAQIFTACSVLLAVRVSQWFGLVNTMVFSHLASNVLLVAMGLAPTAGAAVALLLLRALLAQIDVPTRQAFLMLVVHDDEREATATVTNAGRTVAQAVSPALTGYLMQAVSLSAPFVLGGVLKKIAVARFCRTLGTLVASGVPILEALQITAKTAGNAVVEDAIMETRKRARAGNTPSPRPHGGPHVAPRRSALWMGAPGRVRRASSARPGGTPSRCRSGRRSSIPCPQASRSSGKPTSANFDATYAWRGTGSRASRPPGRR